MPTDQVAHLVLFSRYVRDYMEPAPPILGESDDCGTAVAALADPDVSCVVIADADGRYTGIVTEQDVVHRIAYQLEPSTALATVMSGPVTTISRHDHLFHAIAIMRRHGFRHLPVVDDSGALCGQLHLHTAMAAGVPNLLELVDRLTPGDLARDIGAMKKAQVEFAGTLLGDGVPTHEIQSLLTHFNNDIYRRVISSAIAELRGTDGDPPAAFDVVVMGSGGRGESYLFPDQDNGFIIDDYPDAEHTRIDGYFIKLAEIMTRRLDEVGITYCRGFVMASNPLWRKTTSQWQAQLDIWLRRSSEATLQLSDIFFDFQSLFGEGVNAQAVRDHLTARVKNHHRFLSAMQAVQRNHNVALTRFKRLTVDNDPGPHKGKLNLKYHGLLPLVEAIRLLALREGVPESSTLVRMQKLREGGTLNVDEHDYLAGVFRHISFLVLRQQLADFQAGRTVSAYVSPDELTQRDKDMLIDGLSAIRDLRKRIDHEFTGSIF